MFSDQTGHLRAVFNANYNKPEQYVNALEVLFGIINRVRSLKLNQASKAKAKIKGRLRRRGGSVRSVGVNLSPPSPGAGAVVSFAPNYRAR